MSIPKLTISFVTAALMTSVLSPASAAPKKEPPPPSGTFQVSEGMNRDFCMIEMRAGGNSKLWPTYWFAHPKGQGTMDTAKGSGSFTILGQGNDIQMLSGSRQGTRVGGNLMTVENYKDKNGNEQKRRIGPSIELKVDVSGGNTADFLIAFNGKKVAAKGTAGIRAAKPTGKGGLDISGSCQTTMKELGLDSTPTPVTISFFAPAR